MTAGAVPYIFVNGTTADGPQVNSNFAALVADLNGIDALQITSGTFAIARFPVVTLAKGGSGSDLSATGPGMLQQATNGAVVTIAATGQYLATATNDDAAVGKLGQYQSSNNTGAPVSLSNNTPANMTTLSLTAGDWDVYGDIVLNSSAGMTTTKGAVSTVSGSFAVGSPYEIQNAAGVASLAQFGVPVTRISIAITTTIYLVALAAFGSGTVTASGTLRARRAR